MKKIKKLLSVFAACGLAFASLLSFSACSETSDAVTLRVCSWEEYIDLGGWEEDEKIELESGVIFGKNSMVEDFEEWFNSTHDFNVKVEYSTFGTNEDLYNRLSLGDVYDLVCPSDYLIMKLINEGNYVEYSDGFWDTSVEENYYAKNVSRYIDGENGEGIYNRVFTTEEEVWHKKAACYMWGTTGLVYNPEKIDDVADVTSWNMLLNENYKRQVTIKDNVRDSYFAALGIINAEKLKNGVTAEERSALLNDTSATAVAEAEDVLKAIKNNVYSFETDSGKADMVTGKVVANLQWSGDSVLIMDEADDDGTELWYSVPEECTNLWFDGWVMLKDGIDGSAQRQTAAEAFVNFLSRPDNAVRNMYYIGYTSAIAGDTVYDYMDWNYGAEEGETDVLEYDLSYFFGDGYSLTASATDFEVDGNGNISRGRQLFAQYPTENIIERSVVMLDFGERLGEINQMWINVRCLDLKDVPAATIGIVAGVVGVIAIAILLYVFRYRIFIRYKPKNGYQKV